MAKTYESDLENHLLLLLQELGYFYQHGEDFDPDLLKREREHYRQTILRNRFLDSILRINPQIPREAAEEVANKIADVGFTDLIQENRRIHNLITNGVPIQYFKDDELISDRAFLIDWRNEKNEWLAVNQLAVIGKKKKRPDIICFLNGIPLVVIELKRLESENADIRAAFRQVENYKEDVSDLFRTNAFNIISDGLTARYGSISADFDRYMRWRTIDGINIDSPTSTLAVETLVKGLLTPRNFLLLLRHFVVFEEATNGQTGIVKKIAGYHQFHAAIKGQNRVHAAIATDKRVGVIWHTQGSGKSLLMAFFAGLLVHDENLSNPTILVLTDRNDLDNQLFGTFSRCSELFGQTPEQVDSVADLRQKLDRQVGGIIFSTIQKFKPENGSTNFKAISSRSNLIVFADEAHRTQYGFDAKIDHDTGRRTYGFAHYVRKALPNASFVGFTGTPVALGDRNTEAVFGNVFDTYDITQAVEDEATVPIYYEGKIVKLTLEQEAQQKLDDTFEQLTEDLEEDEKARVSTKWGRIEALVGADQRLDELAHLIVEHYNQREIALQGKAMIVCMSRRICVELYKRIVKLRPDWHSDDDLEGAVKVIMTGSSSDPKEYQSHIRNKTRLEKLASRFRDQEDAFKLVIVRDMWLTGFDAPCMHTIYLDKPMKGHNLMQAIARVNRVFKNKPGGLVVDTIGIGTELKKALNYYSDRDRSNTGIDKEEVIAAFLEHLDIMRSMFHGFDYQIALGESAVDRMRCVSSAINHVYQLEADDKSLTVEKKKAGKRRFMDVTVKLSKAFKLAAGSPEADAAKEEVAFFLAVRVAILKLENDGTKAISSYEIDKAIEQLINRSVASTEVVDVLKACGMERPDISVLSEEFLLEVQGLKQKNLALEALRKLMNGEIKSRMKTNVVKQKQFSERLSEMMAKYHNRIVDAIQVIQELIAIAKELRDEPEDGLTPEEVALYDALADNKSALEVMGSEQLRIVAAELVTTIRENSGVDWYRQTARRKQMRVAIRRILRKYGFPPDLQDEAVKTVVLQAESLATELSNVNSR
jgi:type I restriction enzyme R subunit